MLNNMTCSLLSSPARCELRFSVSSALQVAAGAGAVKTGSGRAGTSVEPVALSGEQAVSRVHVAAAVEPKKMLVEKGNRKKHTLAKTERERG